MTSEIQRLTEAIELIVCEVAESCCVWRCIATIDAISTDADFPTSKLFHAASTNGVEIDCGHDQADVNKLIVASADRLEKLRVELRNARPEFPIPPEYHAMLEGLNIEAKIRRMACIVLDAAYLNQPIRSFSRRLELHKP
jgi:hypothetical protein